MSDFENNISLELGKKMKELREKSGFSQIDLSEKSGISRSYICEIETGKAKVTYARLIKILDILGFSLEINEKKQK